ncbi:ferric reductase like transmembrane component-domain-containing protein [Aspergillus carlsbadensis]|nr:ferric reductase like transmembrane component-domain-containing protein [Aspergillus carlsbadensis]
MELRLVPTLWALLIIATPAHCVTVGRAGHGFIGYGINMYNPPCAYACKATIGNPLNCTMDMAHEHMLMKRHGHTEEHVDLPMGDGWMVTSSPDAECYATNDAFLQTLAYCMAVHCMDVANSTLQRFWEMDVVGRIPGQPLPKMSFQDAYHAVNGTPAVVANSSVILYSVGRIPEESYQTEYRTLSTFERLETTHVRYGLVLLLTGAIIPIACSLLRFLPFRDEWIARFEANFITPPLIGARHNVPFWNTTMMPTRGQAFFIAYIVIINIVLCAAGIESARDSTWYKDREREIASYVSNRAGYLSFANIPLLVLYSSRNNVLLWITDWSHGTFLLLHRWIATIAVVQACLHSAIYLQIYDVDGTHTAESKLPYWFWGIIATLAMVLMIPASILPVRQRFYELFLAWHVFFFLLAMIGCILHIWYRYAWQWGYENWIYIALAIWGFDRVFRVLRLARYGARSAEVTVVDGDYVKIVVRNVKAQGHVYLYFPTLTWRVWENHPFSVLGDTLVCRADVGNLTTSNSTSSASSLEDKEGNSLKNPIDTIVAIDDSKIAPSAPSSTAVSRADHHCHRHDGLTMYIRTHDGITSYIPRSGTTKLPVYVETGYYPRSILSVDPAHTSNVLAFAGGVGVTALTSTLLQHRGYHKLLWASRSEALVKSVREALGEDDYSRLNAVVFTGRRMHIPSILEDEAARSPGVSITVIASGPAEMADEVRREVARVVTQRGAVMSFAEESFSW